MNRYRSLKLFSSRSSIVITLLLSAAAYADDTDWQLHGALTQGAIYTSNNNFYGPSDDSVSLKFTEVDINATARVLPNLRAAAQALYRQAGQQGEGSAVDYAFLDYQYFSTTTATAGVRAGRYKLPLGLFNETRDIAFTRPSIFVPQSAYPDRARDLQLSSDGALLYTDIFTNTGQWTVELDAGRPRIDKQTVESSFGFLPGDVDSVGSHTTVGGRVMYQSGDGTWLAAFSRANAHVRYRQSLTAAQQADIDVKFVYWIASLQCNIDQWSFTSEFGHMDVKLDADVFGAALHPLFYYIQATRHLDKRWSIYSRYDNLYWDRRDPSGADYAALLGSSDFANFAHDYGFGVRYDIDSNLMISTEYHYIDGTAWLSAADNPDATHRYWNMVAVELSYRF